MNIWFFKIIDQFKMITEWMDFTDELEPALWDKMIGSLVGLFK